jgi:hypothetical protein
MVSAVQISPSAVYDDGALRRELGISPTALARARRDGRLRYTQQGRRILYLGSWVLRWLEGSTAPEVVHA